MTSATTNPDSAVSASSQESAPPSTTPSPLPYPQPQISFPRKVWRLLVAIKDGLALVFLLLFFILLFGLLTASPNPAAVRDGALLLELDGWVVEEETYVDPLSLLLSDGAPTNEYSVHDLTHALNSAAGDERIKAVVLDLSEFMGGGQVHMEAVGAALDRVRKADKPVFVYSAYYSDDALMLAAHASEVWLNGLGGAMVAGPGGNRLYYADLLKKAKIDAHVYRVGTYKSAVEPYMRNSMSEDSRKNAEQIYGALWSEWQGNVAKARPKANIKLASETPDKWVEAAGGNLAKAALDAGLVDKVGNRVAFGKRVEEVAGEDPFDKHPGSYAYTDLDSWLADNPREEKGEAIGVVTIAGEIVDGEAGPGTAGGKRIAEVLDDALEDDLAALVVRVDSPGGSVAASEQIRLAIMRHKARDIPVVVSMANIAASGGYWVSTPAERIFAEPSTITGSIGVFSVIPSFEGLASEFGVSADGVKTTALSGQPDVVSGFTPEINAILQSSVESIYDRFLWLVSRSRKQDKAAIDKVAQGQVWDGGTARQLGLVDQLGGLDDALAYAAKRAELEEDDWHPVFLGEDSGSFDGFLPSLPSLMARGKGQSASSAGHDAFSFTAAQQRAALARLQADLARLSGSQGAQAYCMECAGLGGAAAPSAAQMGGERADGWLAGLARLVMQR